MTLLAGGDEPRAENPWALAAVSVAKAKPHSRLMLLFESGDALGIPLPLVSELTNATPDDLRALRLTPARDTIVAEKLDAYISVKGLVRDYAKRVLPFAERFSTIFAARAGSRSSEIKRRSSAENGKKGGRPAKQKSPEHALACKSSSPQKRPRT